MKRINQKYIQEQFPIALEKGYIQAYFQPIFRTVTTKICCAESLARWHDPQLGLLSPSDFIPVLEKNGMIFDLDMEVLRQTCSFYRNLQERGSRLHSFSVNLSRQDFKRQDLFEHVMAILKEQNVPTEAIKLEITESIALEDIDTFRTVFKKFHDAGFSIWIDDFGNAYSSLSMLQNYEFDMMKFDMLFLKNFSRKSRQVLASQINMAKALNIHTLAEGVETEEQLAYLKSSGCETIQGYLFSKPLPADDLIAMIDDNEEILEPDEDYIYWTEIGSLNFLSPSPLEDYDSVENAASVSSLNQNKAPLALVECRQDASYYVYVSDEYLKAVLDLGYNSISTLEYTFNKKQGEQYLMVRKLVQDAIISDTVQELNYVNHDKFYKLRAKCVARKKDRAMLALQLQVFDSDREKKTAQEMLRYGNALFSTYMIVTLIYPDRGASTRIYAAETIPAYDNYNASSLQESIRKFCETEIVAEDRERYLRFFDLNTLETRIAASSRGFIQDVFRLIRHKPDESRWRNIRISRVPSDEERVFIYTIQKVHPKEVRILETIAREHPEMLLNE